MGNCEFTGQLLSRRERETLHHISEGRTYRETARLMGISANTVDTYVRRIRAKHAAAGHGALIRLGLLLAMTERGAGRAPSAPRPDPSAVRGPVSRRPDESAA